MKAFEKWFEKYLNNIKDEWSRSLAKSTEKLYRYIWRAALKWALTQETDLQTTEIADVIRKELQV